MKHEDSWVSLTRREREVRALLSSQQTNKQIANQLAMSRRTALSHAAHILEKRDAASRRGTAVMVRMPGRPDRTQGD